MSHSDFCICCKERSDLVSVHEELSLEGYICSHNSAAALVDHCFNIKIVACDVSYAMCSTCVGQVMQSCMIKDQLVNNLNSSKNFKEEINVKDENNMEMEIAEETFLSDSKIKDEYTADTEIKSSHELEDVFDSDNKVSSDDEQLATQQSQTKDDTKLESCHEYEDVFNSDNSLDDPSFMSDHEKSLTKKPRKRAVVNIFDNVTKKISKSSKRKKNEKPLTETAKQLFNKNESNNDCDQVNSRIENDLIEVKRKSEISKKSEKTLKSDFNKVPIKRIRITNKVKKKTVIQFLRDDFRSLVKHCKDFRLFSWHRSKYKCLVCEELFAHTNNFKIHALKHDIEDFEKIQSKINFSSLVLKVDISSMKCRHCGECVRDLETFRNHLSVSHNYQADNLLKQILPYHLTEPNVKCGVCHKEYVTFSSLNKHMNEHSTNYICPHCGKFFVSHNRLRRHMKNIHLTGTYKCNQCDETFETPYKIKYHKSTVHSAKKYSCQHCSERFKSSSCKIRHLAEVHNEELRKYKCETCPAAYMTGKDLKQHIHSQHIQERNHSCPECGDCFLTLGSLKQHMVRHSGERPFKCNICPKTFARRGNVRQHMRVHNK